MTFSYAHFAKTSVIFRVLLPWFCLRINLVALRQNTDKDSFQKDVKVIFIERSLFLVKWFIETRNLFPHSRTVIIIVSLEIIVPIWLGIVFPDFNTKLMIFPHAHNNCSYMLFLFYQFSFDKYLQLHFRFYTFLSII